MADKFTPGPWEFVYEPYDKRIPIRPVCSLPAYPLGWVDSDDVDPEEAQANAALIAAAPELYEALEAVRLCGNAGAKLTREANRKVRDALAKARGES
jgi:hypothetical protein